MSPVLQLSLTLGLLLIAVNGHAISSQSAPSCASPVYCQGQLLDTVQKSAIFQDSKTFVDMKMRNSVQVTLDNFDKFISDNPNPTKSDVKKFVDDNFEEGNEFDDWQPADFTPTPKLLFRISDSDVKNFTQQLVQVWKTLSRKIKSDVFENEEQYSIIPVENGFIIPGGRFREFYYWDSYWIIRGLIESDMLQTARGMIENFISIVQRYGFIPNGARVYYLNRSQPPLLTSMAHQYVKASKDVKFLQDNVEFFDRELSWWLDNRMTRVEKGGQVYEMAHYDVESPSPRPESYLEDIKTAAFFPKEQDQEQVYCELKSAAESGYDFSTRWFADKEGTNEGNLTTIRTRSIIPVDLNAILCQAFGLLAEFYKELNDINKYAFWMEKSTTLQKTIDEVLYNVEDGIWYDFNLVTKEQRREFYASNFAPLWADAVELPARALYGARAAAYLRKQGILQFKGGIPTSLIQSGEQWDFPNAWPPLQAFVVWGLYKSGDQDAQKIAKDLGTRWVEANMIGFTETQEMFEKYDAVNPGKYGGGGEYTVQSGFGWTNGVVLDFIDLFYTKEN